MFKYLIYKDGTLIHDSQRDDNEVFETEEDAEWEADQYISDWHCGAEVLHLSNPGDWEDTGEEDLYSEIEEI